MTDHDCIAPACVARVGENAPCLCEFHFQSLFPLADVPGAR